MKIAIIQFPGSNSDAESIRAVQTAGMEAEEFLWNRNYADLKNFDGYFIIGGFSYEDRSRSGIIASLDPLMPHLRAEAEKGKLILGICNGAQILVETGLVPGLKNYALGAALATNKRIQNGVVLGTGFYNAWVNVQLSVPSTANAFTRNLKSGQFIHIPIAHGEGRFVIPNDLLEEMKTKNLTAFRYCDDEGRISEEFPVNPNGAVYNLAAISNVAGNVMAMMPHPERTAAGQPIFTSMRDYIAEKKTTVIQSEGSRRSEGSERDRLDSSVVREDSLRMTFDYYPPPLEIKPYTKPENAFELPVKLIITDNEAATVQATLKRLGIPATIERFVHWEVATASPTTVAPTRQAVIDSGELFNANKEKLVSLESASDTTRYLLVRYHDDFEGQAKTETLTSRLALSEVNSVKKGTLWKITTDHGTIQTLVERILATHILFNPLSQNCSIFTP